MNVLFGTQKKRLFFTRIARLAFVGFAVSLAYSLISTIWAVYIDSFVNNISYVGFISAFLTIISFVSFFIFVPLIEKSKKSNVFAWSLFLFVVAYILFYFVKSFYLFLGIAIVTTILTTLRITSFGIIVKDKSSGKSLSKNEGLIYTFFNIAFLVGPLIAGYVASNFGVNSVFIFTAIFIFLALFLFKIFKIEDGNLKKKTDKNAIKNFKDFFRDRDRVIAYFLGGAVNFWWILIYLFMPLYIIRSGLNDLWIGYFLFGVIIPLICFQYKFGSLAGKVGFKKLFRIGFIIPAIFAFLCFLIPNIYFVMVFLVLASIGLAMLESTTEAYFFDLLKKKEELKYYGPYNTAIDVNQFLGELLSAVLLLFLPFKFVFLFFSLFMFLFFFVVGKSKNVIEKNRKRN